MSKITSQLSKDKSWITPELLEQVQSNPKLKDRNYSFIYQSIPILKNIKRR